MQLVRVSWSRSIGPLLADLGAVRAVSREVAAVPIHIALAELRGSPDIVVGIKEDELGQALDTLAARGMRVEVYSNDDYTADRVAHELATPPFTDHAAESLRAVLRPAFDPEAVVTAERDSCDSSSWNVEVRVARESLWRVMMTPWTTLRMVGITGRSPGNDVWWARVQGAAAADADALFTEARRATPRPRGMGCDGISIDLHVRRDGALTRLATWSPTPDDSFAFNYVFGLLRMAQSISPAAALAVATIPRYLGAPQPR